MLLLYSDTACRVIWHSPESGVEPIFKSNLQLETFIFLECLLYMFMVYNPFWQNLQINSEYNYVSEVCHESMQGLFRKNT